MDTNKGIKILRIVSLTLGIISMLFFLYTKVCHAQEIATNGEFPLYMCGYGNYTDYLPDKVKPFITADLLNAYRTTAYSQLPSGITGETNCRTVLMYDANPSATYFEIVYDFSNTRYELTCSTETLGTNVDIWYEYNARCNVRVYYSDGHYTLISRDWGNLNRRIRTSDFLEVSDGSYVINFDKNTSTLYYPMFANFENAFTSSKGFTYFSYPPTTDPEFQDMVQDVWQEGQIVIDSGTQATDTIGTLTNGNLKSWFQAIINSIWNFGNNTVNNLKQFFAPFFNRITTRFTELIELLTSIYNLLLEYIGNDLTPSGIAQVWQTNFENSFVYTLITTGNSIKTALSSLGNTNATAPVITVNLGNNTFFGQTGEYIFTFAWYENIRTGVVTFITAFWLVGLGIHLFTQIPNMIHGVSGTAHGIQNAGGTAIHKQ